MGSCGSNAIERPPQYDRVPSTLRRPLEESARSPGSAPKSPPQRLDDDPTDGGKRRRRVVFEDQVDGRGSSSSAEDEAAARTMAMSASPAQPRAAGRQPPARDPDPPPAPAPAPAPPPPPAPPPAAQPAPPVAAPPSRKPRGAAPAALPPVEPTSSGNLSPLLASGSGAGDSVLQVKRGTSGRLGMSLKDTLVVGVTAGGPAERAGFGVGMQIQSINGVSVSTGDEVSEALASAPRRFEVGVVDLGPVSPLTSGRGSRRVSPRSTALQAATEEEDSTLVRKPQRRVSFRSVQQTADDLSLREWTVGSAPAVLRSATVSSPGDGESDHSRSGGSRSAPSRPSTIVAGADNDWLLGHWDDADDAAAAGFLIERAPPRQVVYVQGLLRGALRDAADFPKPAGGMQASFCCELQEGRHVTTVWFGRHGAGQLQTVTLRNHVWQARRTFAKRAAGGILTTPTDSSVAPPSATPDRATPDRAAIPAPAPVPEMPAPPSAGPSPTSAAVETRPPRSPVWVGAPTPTPEPSPSGTHPRTAPKTWEPGASESLSRVSEETDVSPPRHVGAARGITVRPLEDSTHHSTPLSGLSSREATSPARTCRSPDLSVSFVDGGTGNVLCFFFHSTGASPALQYTVNGSDPRPPFYELYFTPGPPNEPARLDFGGIGRSALLPTEPEECREAIVRLRELCDGLGMRHNLPPAGEEDVKASAATRSAPRPPVDDADLEQEEEEEEEGAEVDERDAPPGGLQRHEHFQRVTTPSQSALDQTSDALASDPPPVSDSDKSLASAVLRSGWMTLIGGLAQPRCWCELRVRSLDFFGTERSASTEKLMLGPGVVAAPSTRDDTDFILSGPAGSVLLRVESASERDGWLGDLDSIVQYWRGADPQEVPPQIPLSPALSYTPRPQRASMAVLSAASDTVSWDPESPTKKRQLAAAQTVFVSPKLVSVNKKAGCIELLLRDFLQVPSGSRSIDAGSVHLDRTEKHPQGHTLFVVLVQPGSRGDGYEVHRRYSAFDQLRKDLSKHGGLTVQTAFPGKALFEVKGQNLVERRDGLKRWLRSVIFAAQSISAAG